MSKKFVCILAVVLLAICLISGGCTPQTDTKITDWKDLLKVSPAKNTQNQSDDAVPYSKRTPQVETIGVELYFASGEENKLTAEKRSIPKVEGIARQTMEELLKGPKNSANKAIAPQGTQLKDINLKPDGLCIVDLSSEARQVGNQDQAETMVRAITNTLGQFSTIKRVKFMINGDPVDSIGHFALSGSIEPDYSW